ncbi:hypothetical protein GCM10010286_29580 [Streptomyces toxytricini]|nr:hypothetical protein GCM10010286_29580 [Streptomyces toxytricini]
MHGGPLGLDGGRLGSEGLLQPGQGLLDAGGALEAGPDVLQGDTRISHPADPQQADHVAVCVAAAVVAAAFRFGEEADGVVVADGAGRGPGERGGIADLDSAGNRRKGHAREPFDLVLAAYWTTCRYGTCKPRWP